MDQHSQSAYRFGDFVCKFAVFPAGEKQKELKSCTQLFTPTPPIVLTA